VIHSFRKEAPMIPDRFWLTDTQLDASKNLARPARF